MPTCIGDQFPLARNAFYYVLPEPSGSFGQQVVPSTNDAEASSGTFTKTHAIAPISCTMGFEQGREFTETAQGTRARVKDRVITGKQKSTWSIETYMDVATGAVRGPDTHNLIKAAVGDSSGSDSATPARNRKFLPATSGNCLETFNVVRVVPDTISEVVFGAAVESMSISMNSGDPVKISFSGSAFNHILTGSSKAAAGVNYSTATNATAIEMNPLLDVYQVQPSTEDYANTTEGAASLWSWKVDEDATGGFAYNKYSKASAYVSEDGGTFNNVSGKFSAGPNDTASNTDTSIVPFLPKGKSSFATTKPVSSTQGQVSIVPLTAADTGSAGSPHAAIITAPITSFDITVNNNIKAIDDQAFTSSSWAGFIPGFRDVEGTITMRVKKDVQGILLHRRDLFRKCAVTIKLGNTAARYVQIDMAYVEFSPSGIEVSGQEELTVSMPFKSMVKDTTAAEVVKDFIIEWK